MYEKHMWGTPDHSLTYYAVRASVRAVVWSFIAVALLGWGIAGVWFVAGVVK